MSLKDDINELTAMNFFEAAYYSEANHGGPNLERLGFLQPVAWPEVPHVEPDYLLIHPARKYCLIVDTKSGHVETRDVRQAKDYRTMDVYKVSDACRKIAKSMGVRNVDVTSFDVCFQYYAHMLAGDNPAHYAASEDLPAIAKYATIVAVDNTTRMWQTSEVNERSLSIVEFDQAFHQGVPLPKDPPMLRRVTKNPSYELLAWAIADWVSGLRFRRMSVQVSAQRIRDELLGSHRWVTLRKIQNVLDRLRDGQFCHLPRQDAKGFITEYSFDAPEKLITDLINPLFAGQTLDEIVLGRS